MYATNTNNNATRVIGVFSDYLKCLDNIRSLLDQKEMELSKLQLGYFKIQEMDDKLANNYNIKIHQLFTNSNYAISNNSNNKSILFTGQLALIKMINNIKASQTNADVSIIVDLNEFWENLKYHLELYQIFIDRFEYDIFNKLKLLYTNTFTDQLSDDVKLQDNDNLTKFLHDLSEYSQKIQDTINKSRLLIKSSGTNVQANLFDNSILTNQLFMDVDIRSHTILRVTPDLNIKLKSIIQICKKWLDREETFVYDMNTEIRQRKLLAKATEQKIKSAQTHQKDLMKSVKSYYLMMQNSKIKLRGIAKDIKLLETHIKESSTELKKLTMEKEKTKTVTDFLNISITQTRMNYGLQIKKQRLENQIVQLDAMLGEMTGQLSNLKDEIITKQEKKEEAKGKLESSEKAFSDARSNLDNYSVNIQEYRAELGHLKQTLTTIESLKTLKSSPEFLENLFQTRRDTFPSSTSEPGSISSLNPSQKAEYIERTIEEIKKTVKIAPSLQDSIKKRKMMRSKQTKSTSD